MTSDTSGHRQRLRERFLKGGEKGIPDYELLELILFGVIPRGDVKPLAKQLLKNFGSLSGIFQADIEKLRSLEGVGDATIVALKVLNEAACRVVREEAAERCVFDSWEAIIQYCRARMSHLSTEQFRLLFIDQKGALIADEVQQQGTVSRTSIYPREVIKRALELGASGLILAHNHPSGDPTPSQADIDMTLKIIHASRELEISVLDHVIIGRFGHTSLRQKKLIP